MTAEDWQQIRVIHCPKESCKGMLLEWDFSPDLKCSDCNKLFMELIDYKEIEE